MNGESVAEELLYARRMTRWLGELEESPSEALRLAVYCQHLRRWMIPRSEYPEGRQGYRRWRRRAAEKQAELAGEVLREVGYEDGLIGRVQALMQKTAMKVDEEAQILEDVACLVFLDHYLAAFAKRHSRDKNVDILRKTWQKMSVRGRRFAQGLALPKEIQNLVDEVIEKS